MGGLDLRTFGFASYFHLEIKGNVMRSGIGCLVTWDGLGYMLLFLTRNCKLPMELSSEL